MKNKHDPIIFILTIIAVVSLSLTVGFSALNASMDIKNSGAIILPLSDIRVSGISVASSASFGDSSYELYTDKNIYSLIRLPNSNSSVTFDVQVTNIGNIEAAINDITGLPSNLKYTINNYTLKDMLCDDLDNTQCKLGSTTTISITISYKQNGYNSSNTEYPLDLFFDFKYITDSVARIGDTLYETLVQAVAAVPYNDTQTTIILLKDTSELIQIENHQNIYLNLNGRTLSNNGPLNVMINKGALTIANGTISSTADQGAINNESTGVLNMVSGNMLVSGRQAIYNNKGIVTISGSSYIKSTSSTRAAVQNLSGGTVTITGGTIIATRFSAVLNAGVMTIGVKDGTPSKTSPLFQGSTYGIENNTSISFYDGIAKGKSRGVKTDNLVSDKEEGAGIVTSTETIDGVSYKTWYIAVSETVTFAPEGGTLSSNDLTKGVEAGNPVGTLPVPTRRGYEFIGWFTEDNHQINENTIINSNITFHAHWNKINDVARIGTTLYDSVQSAVNAAGTTQKTIVLLKNSKEQVTIPINRNIILDLGDCTLSNITNKSVIESKGTLSIIGGTISTNSDNGAAINVLSGNVTISGGSIIATGTRQAAYVTGGTLNITGTAYLSSKADGSYNDMERATVQNVSGILNITGGTIETTTQHAVSNASTMTIGVKDGNISTTTPTLIGFKDGIKSSVAFNFYDGIIKGKTNSIDGTINELETDAQIVNGIDGDYKTAHLEISE